MAEVEGDVEKAEDLGLELEELELRAKELDTRRTSTISAIRSVERTLVALRSPDFPFPFNLCCIDPKSHSGVLD